MTVKQLYDALDTKIPSSLSCEWDNDGLMCCPEPTKEISRVLVTLDVTDKAVTYAIDKKYDLIISHHPLIFKGIKEMTCEGVASKKIIKLIQNGISVFSFHTRLDALCGGVNDRLASLLGLSDTEVFGEEGIGRIGILNERSSAEDFAKKVKSVINADCVRLSDAGKECRKIALLGGSGSDDVEAAVAAGADTFVSGELKYHNMVDAPELGINLVEAGHFFTENPVLEVIADMVSEIAPKVCCDLFYSNNVKLI